MSAEKFKTAAIATAAVAAVAGTAGAADAEKKATELDKLVAAIRDGDDDTRGDAWQGAWKYGAPAVPRLADLMAHENFEVVRAAKRGLWEITRHSGRPGAENERQGTVKALIPLLKTGPTTKTKREVLWMLSEIAGDEAVEPITEQLKNEEIRDDARSALERLPGNKSLAALKAALKSVPDDFKPNIAQALRARGEKVSGFPCQKMVPTKQTEVKPVEG